MHYLAIIALVFFALFLVLVAFANRIPPPMPKGFETPIPPRVRSQVDRLAASQRRAHAREVAQADQEVHRVHG